MRALIVAILCGALAFGAMALVGPHIKQAGREWRAHHRTL